MRRGIVALVGVALLILIVMGGLLKLSGYLDVLILQVETASLQAQATYESAYAERLHSQAELEEKRADVYRAQGEKELKQREGMAILYPAIAASFSVFTQSFLLACWNILIPIAIIGYTVGKFFQPWLVDYFKWKQLHKKPTITYTEED